ncbi:MAG: alkaline phosphatase family protein [Bacteroidetes bacterium]|nr:alkaline phosphatase family protein [Bacteroidota bacterium]
MTQRNLFFAAFLVAAISTTLFAQKTKPGQSTLQPPASASPKQQKEKEVLTPKMAPEAADLAENLDIESYKPKPIDTTTAPAIIAFGSCNKMEKPQTMWEWVNANEPNLWIWLGDIVYADTTDVRALTAHYKLLKTNPDYKRLRSKAQVVGVYDDHDYGKNGGDKYLTGKKGTKKCLLDFLDVPANNPVRKREGAYQAYTFGKGAQRIKVIMMDTRYFRDSLSADPTKQKRFLPNPTGDILGEAQWQWLERELTHNQANLTLLCSSVQVLSDEHGYDKWGNFPNARKRLLSLIVKAKPKNLLILSGDRHMAEISKMDLQGLPYPLYDFTSSGLTHIRSGLNETNKFRVGDMVVKRNFGVLKIRWEAEHPVVTMQVRGLQNELFEEIINRY